MGADQVSRPACSRSVVRTRLIVAVDPDHRRPAQQYGGCTALATMASIPRCCMTTACRGASSPDVRLADPDGADHRRSRQPLRGVGDRPSSAPARSRATPAMAAPAAVEARGCRRPVRPRTSQLSVTERRPGGRRSSTRLSSPAGLGRSGHHHPGGGAHPHTRAPRMPRPGCSGYSMQSPGAQGNWYPGTALVGSQGTRGGKWCPGHGPSSPWSVQPPWTRGPGPHEQRWRSALT